MGNNRFIKFFYKKKLTSVKKVGIFVKIKLVKSRKRRWKLKGFREQESLLGEDPNIGQNGGIVQ